jgi:phospholipase C
MGNYDDKDLPFYYFLGRTYALSDRYFAPMRGPTIPNREFIFFGSSDTMTDNTGCPPSPVPPSIFDSLDAAHVTYGAYTDNGLLNGALCWNFTHPNTGTITTFLSKLDAGTLPQVSFVDSGPEQEHPPQDIQVGEAWSRNIYEHAVASPLWPGLALFWTYDEGGGLADHVPPPNNACAPDATSNAKFTELGARVPFVAISPYARKNYVSHVVEDHTAITRFIETVFDLPALTARDANSSGLLDLFDFSCAPSLITPPTAPAAGTGGCVLDGGADGG